MYRRVRGKAAKMQGIRAASTQVLHYSPVFPMLNTMVNNAQVTYLSFSHLFQAQRTSYLIVAHLSQPSTVLVEKETPAPPVHCPLGGPVDGGEVKGLRGPAETLQMLG